MLVGEDDLYKEFEGDSEFKRCGFCHKKYFRKEFLRVQEFETIAEDICPYCNGLNSMCGPNFKYINYKIEDIDVNNL